MLNVLPNSTKTLDFLVPELGGQNDARSELVRLARALQSVSRVFWQSSLDFPGELWILNFYLLHLLWSLKLFSAKAITRQNFPTTHRDYSGIRRTPYANFVVFLLKCAAGGHGVARQSALFFPLDVITPYFFLGAFL